MCISHRKETLSHQVPRLSVDPDLGLPHVPGLVSVHAQKAGARFWASGQNLLRREPARFRLEDMGVNNTTCATVSLRQVYALKVLRHPTFR